MAAVYYAQQMSETATFTLFARDLPRRNFYVAAGLEDALDALENYRFTPSDIDYLKQTGLFDRDFLSSLKDFHFTGTIHALPEGTIFFPNEPIMEVSAPIIEAQLVETFLLNTIGFQTMIATKAARCVYVAKGKEVVDFSSRRTQGLDAIVKVPRNTYIAGFSGTSSVLAGKRLGIPISGTMAHSFVSAFDNEISAFEAFATVFPGNSIFLIDTYNTMEGAKKVVSVARKMKEKGQLPIGIRLDSGDIVDLRKKVRRLFDEAGLYEVKIFASGGLDEYRIAKIIKEGAPIDAFGVGTKIGVSSDAPYMDIVYKMVRYGKKNVRKISPNKITLAGEKQVFRFFDDNGLYAEDIIGMRDENYLNAKPLLELSMVDGTRLNSHPNLTDIRKRFEINFSRLEEKYKSITKKISYPVRISQMLAALQNS
jgi:nicotinate phosphoribosyltransferase